MDVRSMVIAWPEDAPRGAVARFCRENEISRSRFYELRARAESESVLSALQPRLLDCNATRPAIDIEIEELAVRIRKELAQHGWDHAPSRAAPDRAMRLPRRQHLLCADLHASWHVTAQPQKRPKTSYLRF